MCRAVAEALVTGTHLVLQAGTGTGKSLASLVPAAQSGMKVVVATATKAPPRPELQGVMGALSL
jgi:ATP-dependent DNA helicase DinG